MSPERNASRRPARRKKSTASVALLRILANERRLMIVGELMKTPEVSVTSPARAVGLSQSALSQHLAKMRAAGMVAYRREGLTVRYRLAKSRMAELLVTLHELFSGLSEDGKTGKG